MKILVLTVAMVLLPCGVELDTELRLTGFEVQRLVEDNCSVGRWGELSCFSKTLKLACTLSGSYGHVELSCKLR